MCLLHILSSDYTLEIRDTIPDKFSVSNKKEEMDRGSGKRIETSLRTIRNK